MPRPRPTTRRFPMPATRRRCAPSRTSYRMARMHRVPRSGAPRRRSGANAGPGPASWPWGARIRSWDASRCVRCTPTSGAARRRWKSNRAVTSCRNGASRSPGPRSWPSAPWPEHCAWALRILCPLAENLPMNYRQTVDFLLHDWLCVQTLQRRVRYADHSQETFASVLDTCERIAREKYAPFNRLTDTEEPWFDGEKVHLPAASHAAAQAYFESGMLAAAQDYEIGGMQLPCVVGMAANSFFSKAAIGVGGGAMLTSGNANLLMKHGTLLQQEVFAKHEFSGRFAGTMCLSEPQAGSSLSDIATRATPDGPDYESDPLGPRYRLRGNKMWISNGEHELTENIIHLVLAKIPGTDGRLPPGARGISLFIVPKRLVDTDGRLTGERNDVAIAGLNHKLGYRGIPNTLLNFGEGKFPVRGAAGAIGYLVGKPHEGLRAMFHMMNEARIAVGLGATMLGFAGYEASLEYAKTRPQGRPIGPGGKDATQPQVRIIEHADVKRMLLAQKSYCEGALALELYCARLVDELHSGDGAAQAHAHLLLEVLTPIA